jgi:invasion protein IalB
VGIARFSVIVVAMLAAFPGDAPGQAQPSAQAKSLGTFDAWNAWEHGEQASKVCYVSAAPASSQTKPPGVRRGQVWVMVSHRMGANARDEVSFQAGYPIKGDRPVTAVVDRTRSFELSNRSTAIPETIWAKDPATGRAMIAAMRTGRELVVNGTSQRGTTTTDAFKLDGFAKALDAANRACPAPR